VLTGGLFLPLLRGFKGILYPSPLHYEEIPKLAKDVAATIILGIDTFAAAWAKSAEDDAFRTLRLCVLGAERVKDATRALWMERFGLDVQEGYGVTEAAPVLAVNTDRDNRPGTVGRLLPGVEIRLEPVEGINTGKRMIVRGPNVMAGYYFPEEPGKLHPPPGGWHDTGDIVTIDEDGYVAIVSRAKRFAKIAGEMVSLAAVESVLADAYPDYLHATVAIPDARRGEAIVIATTAPGLSRIALLPVARRLGLTELAVPDRVMVVEALPLLGSGKTDYPTLEKMAVDWAAARAATSAG
jgi:acyl-[acyl-carrier-protein]-phospholipid O-acyltransferase/long-chain-fatty-acid--[acyl-carrier-protein] ligase